MEERERLADILMKKYDHFCDQCGVNKQSNYIYDLADYLLENGVIVPPCKVGDTVYEIEYDVGSYELWEARPIESKVTAICLLTEYDYYPLDKVGEDVFLTRKEAERAVEEERV